MPAALTRFQSSTVAAHLVGKIGVEGFDVRNVLVVEVSMPLDEEEPCSRALEQQVEAPCKVLERG